MNEGKAAGRPAFTPQLKSCAMSSKPIYTPGPAGLITTALITVAATVVDATDRHGSRRLQREAVEERLCDAYRRNTSERRVVPHRAPPIGGETAVAQVSTPLAR